MRLQDGIVTHQIDKDFITIFTSDDPNAFHGVLRSNATANFIMDCLKSETTKEKILEKMKQTWRGDEHDMAADIDIVLDNLRRAQALVE